MTRATIPLSPATGEATPRGPETSFRSGEKDETFSQWRPGGSRDDLVLHTLGQDLGRRRLRDSLDNRGVYSEGFSDPDREYG